MQHVGLLRITFALSAACAACRSRCRRRTPATSVRACRVVAGREAREALELVPRERLGREQVERGRPGSSSSFRASAGGSRGLPLAVPVTTTVVAPRAQRSTERTWCSTAARCPARQGLRSATGSGGSSFAEAAPARGQRAPPASAPSFGARRPVSEPARAAPARGAAVQKLWVRLHDALLPRGAGAIAPSRRAPAATARWAVSGRTRAESRETSGTTFRVRGTQGTRGASAAPYSTARVGSKPAITQSPSRARRSRGRRPSGPRKNTISMAPCVGRGRHAPAPLDGWCHSKRRAKSMSEGSTCSVAAVRSFATSAATNAVNVLYGEGTGCVPMRVKPSGPPVEQPLLEDVRAGRAPSK